MTTIITGSYPQVEKKIVRHLVGEQQLMVGEVPMEPYLRNYYKVPDSARLVRQENKVFSGLELIWEWYEITL